MLPAHRVEDHEENDRRTDEPGEEFHGPDALQAAHRSIGNPSSSSVTEGLAIDEFTNLRIDEFRISTEALRFASRFVASSTVNCQFVDS